MIMWLGRWCMISSIFTIIRVHCSHWSLLEKSSSVVFRSEWQPFWSYKILGNFDILKSRRVPALLLIAEQANYIQNPLKYILIFNGKITSHEVNVQILISRSCILKTKFRPETKDTNDTVPWLRCESPSNSLYVFPISDYISLRFTYFLTIVHKYVKCRQGISRLAHSIVDCFHACKLPRSMDMDTIHFNQIMRISQRFPILMRFLMTCMLYIHINLYT